MMTNARIYTLNTVTNEMELRSEFMEGDFAPEVIERHAYTQLSIYLSEQYPGQWCYRYATLNEGVTVESPGTLVDKYYPDGRHIDGVTDMSLIADGGFTGQFQWIEGGLSGKVPGYVETDDPERDARHAAAQEAYRLEEKRKADALVAKLETMPTIQLADGKADEWAKWVEINSTDAYSSAVVTYAVQWARLMQAEINPDFRHLNDVDNNPDYVAGARLAFAEAAERTSHEADTVGLSGFQYGCAVSMLAQMWVHGEELRRWHNKEWGAPEDAKGTVNPALLTIG